MATRWRDLSDKEKGFFGGDKSTFQTALGRAADAGADLNRARSIEDYIVKPKPKPSPSPSPSPSPQQEAVARVQEYQAPTNIQDYDLTAHGAGSSKGTNRISGADIVNMRDSGNYSVDEIISFAEGAMAGGSKYGQNTLNKLASLRAERDAQKQQPQPAPTPTPTPEPKYSVKTGDRNITQGDTSIDFGDYGKGSGGNNVISGVTGDNTVGRDAINSTINSGTIKSGVGGGSGGNNAISGVTGDNSVGRDLIGSTMNSGIIDQGFNIAGADGAEAFLDNFKEGVASGIDEKSDDMVVPPGVDNNNAISGTSGDNTVGRDAINSVINSGLIDQSVSISETGRGGGLSNFGGALAGMAINNNMMNRDFGQFGMGQALSTIRAADNEMGIKERNNNIEKSLGNSFVYSMMQAQNMGGLLYGDMMNPAHSRMKWGPMGSFKTKEPDYSKAEEIYNS